MSQHLGIVTYPPTYDGELHVKMELEESAFPHVRVEFTIVIQPGDSMLDTVKRACLDMQRMQLTRKV